MIDMFLKQLPPDQIDSNLPRIPSEIKNPVDWFNWLGKSKVLGYKELYEVMLKNLNVQRAD